MSEKKYSFPVVYMVTGNYWSGMEYQRHHFARHFAKSGIPVVFIERSPQRMPVPGLKDLLSWFFKRGQGNTEIKNKIPENIKVLNPRLLPPANWLRFINRSITKKFLSELQSDNNFNKKLPLVITYIPTFNTLDLIQMLEPCTVAYVNVHNFESDIVMPDLLKAEKEIIKRSDILFGDSLFNVERVKKISGGKEVFQSLPGVNYEHFSESFRGDETKRKKTLYYFGGIGKNLDMELYNLLSDELKIVFAGVVDEAIRNKISEKITLLPPVSNAELPGILRDADMLGLFYKKDNYMDAVVPAKFFECLATGKPMLVSGLNEAKPYLDIVYDAEGKIENVKKIISEISILETNEKLMLRKKIAEETDWSNRFELFAGRIENVYVRNFRIY